jgi:hypothetical protein
MLSRTHRRYNRPTRQERDEARHGAWLAQMPHLFKTYMEYKYSTYTRQVPKDEPPFEISVLGIDGKPGMLVSLIMTNRFARVL